MDRYDHKKIEEKWQKVWEKNSLYQTKDDSKKEKSYLLVEFPYPSGDGLHNGHVRPYTGMDVIARKRRAEGMEVLFPIGWDAFGLPTENYAIKTGKVPKDVTKTNTDNFRRQIKSVGISFDWSREINTTDPEYYKWTQWIFLKLFEKGLAYKDTIAINWCLSCKIGLANEEVIDGKCERCGEETEKRNKEQWMLAITKYADRLDKDLDDVDYIEPIKLGQRNWIGKSEGAELSFAIKDSDKNIDVFTTRPDTLYGATYMVLAPEYSIVGELASKIENIEEVKKYIKEASKKTEIERTAEGKEKTGVELKGLKAVNPANKEEIPIYIADYVLAEYGTGAIMAVPAHDERDNEFAQKFKLPIREVVIPNIIDKRNPPIKGKKQVERQVVQVIVRDPSNNKFLCLQWKKHPWTTFPMGGVEEGESVIDAAKRELYEETGYKDVKFVRILGGQVRAEYFAAHKNENRIAFTNAVYFELEKDEADEISDEEKAIHDVAWLDSKDMNHDVLVHAELDVWLNRLKKDYIDYSGEGVLINSGDYNDIPTEEARKQITKSVAGKVKTTYKLRDWVFSRQRYWGEPIPMIHCASDGWVPVPVDELPVKLPEVKKYEPSDDGESPLSQIDKFVNTKCPKCNGDARRETDTMPNWAGSSWYYLRYVDPKNRNEFASQKLLKEWSPVDWYNGGMEHTTLHLLYSRFWHKFLFDEGLVPTHEPYSKRTAHGLILANGGEKMSKSKGNVINPDDVVESVGADTLRTYEMFMGPFDQAIPWSTDNMVGSRRFLERVWNAKNHIQTENDSDGFLQNLHMTIKKVGDDIEAMKFNTAVSSLMVCLNEIEKAKSVSRDSYLVFLQLLAPFAPHITEELHEKLGEAGSIHQKKWPKFDDKRLSKEEFTIVVQVNGKVRGKFVAPKDATKEEVLEIALGLPKVKEYVDGKNMAKTIHIINKLLNIVV